MTEVEDWLNRHGMSAYAQSFLDNRIDLSVAADLNDQDLRELGIVLGDRKKLLRAIAELSTASPAPPRASTLQDAAERRQLTVMFCDLVGSTALSTQLDPEDLRDIIGAYHRTCADLVRQNGGFVAKYMGDGVLIYFGYPHAHEHDAEHALQAARALVEAIPKLLFAAGSPLQVRVGIATGLVVVGDIVGSGEAQERGVVGETPNLAARLQAIAEPGMVVISESTRRLIGDLFTLQSLGAHHLKGISGPVQAFAVLDANAAQGRFDALHRSGLTSLVGRELESELLAHGWSKAAAGEGQVILLSGEAGIGKSRLLAALLERLANAPGMELRYFCSPQHTNSALHPITKQMEHSAGLTRDDTPKTKLDKLDAVLAPSSISSEDHALLAEMLDLANDGRYPALQLASQARRERTLEAIMAHLDGLARTGPMVIVFEDLHWADPSCLEVLSGLVERIAALPVLLVVTFRTEFVPPWPARPHVTAIELSRLEPQAIDGLIERVAGGQSLPLHIRQEIIDRTDGIPLFVEEMTKAVLEAGNDGDARRTTSTIPSGTMAVPATLHASLMARLDRLGAAKEVAQIGAVIGREFSHALLASIAGRGEAELARLLERLVAAGLLFRQGELPSVSYLFNHALVQDAAYGTLLRDTRRALHGSIAACLQTNFAEIAGAQPELVAHHYTQAGRLREAASFWSEAGRRSLARSALVEAAQQLSRALDQIATLPENPAVRREQIALQVELANALIHVRGHAAPETKVAFDRARLLMERADTLGEPLDDRLMLFAVLYGFWVANRMAFKAEVTRELAAQFQALAEHRKAKTPIMIGHLLMGISLVLAGEFAEGRRELDSVAALYNPGEHRALAMRFGHDVLVSALSWRAFAQWALGDLGGARADIEHALGDARAFGHAATLMYALSHASLTLIQCGDLPAADALVDELIGLAGDKGTLFWKAYGILLRGQIVSLEGNHPGAVDILESGVAAMRSTGATGYTPWYLCNLAGACAQIGRIADARRYLDEAMLNIQSTGERWQEVDAHLLAGAIAQASGEPASQVEARFKQALAVAQKQGAKSFELRAAMALASL